MWSCTRDTLSLGKPDARLPRRPAATRNDPAHLPVGTAHADPLRGRRCGAASSVAGARRRPRPSRRRAERCRRGIGGHRIRSRWSRPWVARPGCLRSARDALGTPRTFCPRRAWDPAPSSRTCDNRSSVAQGARQDGGWGGKVRDDECHDHGLAGGAVRGRTSMRSRTMGGEANSRTGCLVVTPAPSPRHQSGSTVHQALAPAIPAGSASLTGCLTCPRPATVLQPDLLIAARSAGPIAICRSPPGCHTRCSRRRFRALRSGTGRWRFCRVGRCRTGPILDPDEPRPPV